MIMICLVAGVRFFQKFIGHSLEDTTVSVEKEVLTQNAPTKVHRYYRLWIMSNELSICSVLNLFYYLLHFMLDTFITMIYIVFKPTNKGE